MKKFKKLIPAMVMLLIATMLMGTTTYAWFSMNKTVTASNMMVKAKAEGSLVITSTSSLPAAGTTSTDWNFNDTTATEVFASTHDWTNGATTGLAYVSNPEKINPETGTQLNSTSTLTYADAVNGTKVYYKDYSVYLAGAEGEFTNQNIAISLTGTIANSNDINKAVSIDFYGVANATAAATVSEANYKGTLNVAGVKNNASKNGTDAYTTFTISGVDIPATGSNKAYAITMRVYYDGALIETAGTNAYTVYTEATGTKPNTNAPYYYVNDNGVGVATVADGADVSSYYIVNVAGSAHTFAKTVEVTDLSDVTLQVTFTASAAS